MVSRGLQRDPSVWESRLLQGKGKEECHITSTSETAEVQEMGLGTLPLTLKQGSVKSLGQDLGLPVELNVSQPAKATNPAMLL